MRDSLTDEPLRKAMVCGRDEMKENSNLRSIEQVEPAQVDSDRRVDGTARPSGMEAFVISFTRRELAAAGPEPPFSARDSLVQTPRLDTMASMSKRLDEAMRAMDTQRADADGRVRLGGTQARAEGVFLTSLFSGAFGVVVFLIAVAALAALLVWLYA